MPSDAEARYLDSIADDCRRILGPDIELDAVERFEDEPDRVRLVARYRTAAAIAAETVADGETVVEAHSHLREQLAIDRLRFAFSHLVEAKR